MVMLGMITERMMMLGMIIEKGVILAKGWHSNSHFSYSLTDVIVLYSYTCPSLHCYSPIRVHMSNERIDKQQ